MNIRQPAEMWNYTNMGFRLVFVNQIEGSGIGIKDDSTHCSDNGGAVSTPSTPMVSAKKTTGKPTVNEKALERTGLAAPVRRLLFC